MAGKYERKDESCQKPLERTHRFMECCRVATNILRTIFFCFMILLVAATIMFCFYLIYTDNDIAPQIKDALIITNRCVCAFIMKLLTAFGTICRTQ